MKSVIWILQVAPQGANEHERALSAASAAKQYLLNPESMATEFWVGPEKLALDLVEGLGSLQNDGEVQRVELSPGIHPSGRILQRVHNLQQFIAEYENGETPEGMSDREVADSLLRWKRELDTIMWCINAGYTPYYEAD